MILGQLLFNKLKPRDLRIGLFCICKKNNMLSLKLLNELVVFVSKPIVHIWSVLTSCKVAREMK